MSHSTDNMTLAELSSKMTVDCAAFAAPISYPVQQWLTYRDELLNWENDQFMYYGGATQYAAITDALNERYGRRWWANHG